LNSPDPTASTPSDAQPSVANTEISVEDFGIRPVLKAEGLFTYTADVLKAEPPREMTSPPIPLIAEQFGSEVSRDVDRVQLRKDWMDLMAKGYAGSLIPYLFMNRLARREFWLGDLEAAETTASIVHPVMSYRLTNNSAESIFCETTLALSAFHSCGWSKADSALQDIADRAELLGGPLGLLAMSALAGRAAIAAEVEGRDLSIELHNLLVERSVKAYGISHPFTISDRLNRAVEIALAGDLVYALSLSRSCEEDALVSLGSLHRLRCMAAARTGQFLSALGVSHQAVKHLRLAARLHAAVFGEDHPRTLNCRTSLALALLHCGSTKEAERTLRAAALASEPVGTRTSLAAAEAEEARERLWFLMEDMGILEPGEEGWLALAM
jgi:hypothetical protein